MTGALKFRFLLVMGLAALLAAFGAGCVGSLEEVRPAESAGQDLKEEEYFISPNDTLKIEVYPDSELSRGVTVGKDGIVKLPLLGELKVEGLSVLDLEKKLTKLLAKDYLVNPQVEIRVEQFHTLSVSVLGEVKSPGSYKLQSDEGGTTLLEAIAMAGGFTEVANIKKIKIIRMEDKQKKVYKINAENIIKGEKKDIRLKPNDVIVVEQSWF